MSNYYKGTARLSEICKSITDTKTEVYTIGFLNLSITTGGTKTFTSTVDETPLTLGYEYEGTDISTYCIAAYVESSGTQFTSIPTWCTKIRAVLVGGGGSGASGIKGNNAFTPSVNQHYLDNEQVYLFVKNDNSQQPIDRNTFYQNDQNQSGLGTHHEQNVNHYDLPAVNHQTSGVGGGGGGGGSFVYLPNITIVPGASVNITNGSAGGNTVLTVQLTTYTAVGGKNASRTSKGAGGTYTISGAINKPGDDGGDAIESSAGLGGQSNLMKISSLTYGKGGNGSDGTAGTRGVSNEGGTVAAPQGGASGYYRIYFLTD